MCFCSSAVSDDHVPEGRWRAAAASHAATVCFRVCCNEEGFDTHVAARCGRLCWQLRVVRAVRAAKALYVDTCMPDEPAVLGRLRQCCASSNRVLLVD